MPEAPTLDAKVTETANGGWSVSKHEEPAAMPPSPTVKLKGFPADGRFTRAGGEFTWDPPISIDARIQVYDGASLEWEWSAREGDIVGGP